MSTTSEGLFKPMVMFFGLMNLLATFQTIMNKILQSFINTRKIMSFINNAIVRIEIKEEHDNIVEEVVSVVATTSHTD